MTSPGPSNRCTLHRSEALLNPFNSDLAPFGGRPRTGHTHQLDHIRQQYPAHPLPVELTRPRLKRSRRVILPALTNIASFLNSQDQHPPPLPSRDLTILTTHLALRSRLLSLNRFFFRILNLGPLHLRFQQLSDLTRYVCTIESYLPSLLRCQHSHSDQPPLTDQQDMLLREINAVLITQERKLQRATRLGRVYSRVRRGFVEKENWTEEIKTRLWGVLDGMEASLGGIVGLLEAAGSGGMSNQQASVVESPAALEAPSGSARRVRILEPLVVFVGEGSDDEADSDEEEQQDVFHDCYNEAHVEELVVSGGSLE